CPKCLPGYRVQEDCGEFKDTLCAPCTRGTYTAHLNHLDECLPCHVCDPGMGQVTRQKCYSWRNTVCGCDQGHFCVQEDGDSCAECRPHSACSSGQRVKETGTEWQDTVCEDCPPGTFSTGGTQAVCQPWTKCCAPLQREAKPGTNSTDVTCSYLVPVVVILSVSLLGLCISYIRFRRTCEFPERRLCFECPKQQAERAPEAVQTLQVSKVQPEVTRKERQHLCSLRATQQRMNVFQIQISEPLHQAEDEPGHRSGDFGDRTYLSIKFLRCLGPSSLTHC
ncbi:PREDICTED: tumor necrosis factor receptor superfamily member 14, partial [Miniopterus natalensis]|uniref:tumor necrosis factor receptor superfamily member 14 n=1 Tax=Miniopterus natalensis TaxID=291302 RepID=UPI0007A6E4B6